MDIDLDKDLHRIDINFENIFYNVNVPKQKGKSRFSYTYIYVIYNYLNT